MLYNCVPREPQDQLCKTYSCSGGKPARSILAPYIDIFWACQANPPHPKTCVMRSKRVCVGGYPFTLRKNKTKENFSLYVSSQVDEARFGNFWCIPKCLQTHWKIWKNSKSLQVKISCATSTKPLAQLCQESVNVQTCYFPTLLVQFIMLIDLSSDKWILLIMIMIIYSTLRIPSVQPLMTWFIWGLYSSWKKKRIKTSLESASCKMFKHGCSVREKEKHRI